MQSDHSPKPWRLDDTTHPLEYRQEHIAENYHYIEAGNGCIGNDGRGFGLAGVIGVADARLIVAAPNMLDALERILVESEGKHSQECCCSLCEIAYVAKLAIAMATGAEEPKQS